LNPGSNNPRLPVQLFVTYGPFTRFPAQKGVGLPSGLMSSPVTQEIDQGDRIESLLEERSSKACRAALQAAILRNHRFQGESPSALARNLARKYGKRSQQSVMLLVKGITSLLLGP
jgi:hypothetical protein